MPSLGVNIDHVASLRQLRKGIEPEPVLAAFLCLASGADSIVVHLREDRRHIQDRDVYALKEVVRGKLNLEMSVAPDIVAIACEVKPHQSTLVPEKRQEVTTEGGLDVVKHFAKVKSVVNQLARSGITVSLFIDPEKKQIDASRKAGVHMIELHTGRYADAKDEMGRKKYLAELRKAVRYARGEKLTVNAGHGLDYHNVGNVAVIDGIAELNIGYSIVCRAVSVGLSQAVREMKALIAR
jgi:pyridoxine 5-phosphate synthase